MKKYEMKDLSLLYHFLGMGIVQSGHEIFIIKMKYTLTLLEKFDLKDCKPVSIHLAMNDKLKKGDGSQPADEIVYRKIVESILYLITTRPDIMFAGNLLSRFVHNPTKKHFGTVKRVLIYIQGTIDYGIEYEKGKSAILSTTVIMTREEMKLI